MKLIPFPSDARKPLPRWARPDASSPSVVRFKPGRPKAAKAAKPAKAAREAQHPAEDKEESRMTPAIPHYWDVMIMREILELPDVSPRHATAEARKFAETKAFAAQRRVMANFASKYLELEKTCKRLRAENAKLKGSSSKSRAT